LQSRFESTSIIAPLASQIKCLLAGIVCQMDSQTTPVMPPIPVKTESRQLDGTALETFPCSIGSKNERRRGEGALCPKYPQQEIRSLASASSSIQVPKSTTLFWGMRNE